MTLFRKAALLAIVPLLGALGLVSHARLFLCSGDHFVRTECCCPEQTHRVSEATALSSPCCCDIVRREPEKVAFEPARRPDGACQPLQTVVVDAPDLHAASGLLPMSAVRSFEARPPPFSIQLLKHSFLI